MKALVTGVVALVVLGAVGCGMQKPKGVDKSLATYRGAVADYHGGKKLVVAFTASWAGVWKLTEPELRKLDFEVFDLCIVDADVDTDETRAYGIDFWPTVALVKDGKIVAKVQNLTRIEELAEW